MASTASSSSEWPVINRRTTRGRCRWTHSNSCTPERRGMRWSVSTTSKGRVCSSAWAASAPSAVATSNSGSSSAFSVGSRYLSSSTTSTEDLSAVTTVHLLARRRGKLGVPVVPRKTGIPHRREKSNRARTTGPGAGLNPRCPEPVSHQRGGGDSPSGPSGGPHEVFDNNSCYRSDVHLECTARWEHPGQSQRKEVIGKDSSPV